MGLLGESMKGMNYGGMKKKKKPKKTMNVKKMKKIKKKK